MPFLVKQVFSFRLFLFVIFTEAKGRCVCQEITENLTKLFRRVNFLKALINGLRKTFIRVFMASEDHDKGKREEATLAEGGGGGEESGK